MTGYNLDFDIASTPVRLDAWIIPLVILPVVGACLVFFPALMSRILPGGLKGGARTVFSWFFFLFSTSISLFAVGAQTAAYLDLRDARLSGNFASVEGCLQGFHPMPEGGHDSERLLIQGRHFEYSDYIITPAFNNSESHGGPIHPDSQVRIGFVGSHILRLETMDHACPRAPDIGPGDS